MVERVADEQAAPAAAAALTGAAGPPVIARLLAVQRSAGNRAARRLIARTPEEDFQAAVQVDWRRAAEILEGFSVPETLKRLRQRTPDEIMALHQGALESPPPASASPTARPW